MEKTLFEQMDMLDTSGMSMYAKPRTPQTCQSSVKCIQAEKQNEPLISEHTLSQNTEYRGLNRNQTVPSQVVDNGVQEESCYFAEDEDGGTVVHGYLRDEDGALGEGDFSFDLSRRKVVQCKPQALVVFLATGTHLAREFNFFLHLDQALKKPHVFPSLHALPRPYHL